ncbi:hypothetical protein [Bacillus velezensis]|uniref:hypothetical protein n=1 Tax=Bacillus velezensis TaxID=492670 RepID=UPI003C6C8878
MCCREEFKNSSTLRTLPCAHNYCEKCLRVLAIQGCKEESSDSLSHIIGCRLVHNILSLLL